MRAGVAIWVVATALALSGCKWEKRVIDVDQPVTEPVGAHDPRAGQFRDNAFQISQGGRYFAWYGCNDCHGQRARSAANLADRHWRHGRTIDRTFASITGHDPNGERIPVEQRWQLAAYVLQLSALDPAQRHRQDLDAVGEARAGDWKGPVQ